MRVEGQTLEAWEVVTTKVKSVKGRATKVMMALLLPPCL